MLDLPKISEQNPQTSPSRCTNCGSALEGPYCAQCGQSSASMLKYFWLVVMQLLEDILSFDSRARRTLIPLLLRPGFLTNEYIAGRRVRYVPPLRLYLFISIIFFLCMQLAASNGDPIKATSMHSALITDVKAQIAQFESMTAIGKTPLSEQQQQSLTSLNKHLSILEQNLETPQHELSIELVELELEKINHPDSFSDSDARSYAKLTKMFNEISTMDNQEDIDDVLFDINLSFLSAEQNTLLGEKIAELKKKADKAIRSDATPLVKQTISVLPQLMVVLLPLFALLLKIMFVFSKRLYMEHLTVALHSHSFIFFMLLWLSALSLITDHIFLGNATLETIVNFIASISMIWIPVYLFMMQRSVYRQSVRLTLVKYLVIGWVYCLLIALTAFSAFIWGLTTL